MKITSMVTSWVETVSHLLCGGLDTLFQNLVQFGDHVFHASSVKEKAFIVLMDDTRWCRSVEHL